MRISVWSPDLDAARPRPLLVCNDGPMYAEQVGLPRFAARLGCRVALLEPADRLADYSASPAYAAELALAVLPRIVGVYRTAGRPVGIGASLGALAMMHAHQAYPGVFGGLFLQSGSFFDPALDPQEAGRFPHFAGVTEFVASIKGGNPVPVVIQCGLAEENLANNRQLAGVLRGLGYPVDLVQTPGGHHHETWLRGIWPALRDLVRRAADCGA